MIFGPAPRRRSRENIVPMINVVFLLLIFFLMTAQISPPAPYDITPPVSDGDEAQLRPDTLYLVPDQPPAFNALRGPAALQVASQTQPLQIRADAALPGTDLARTLSELSALGATDITLIAEAK